MLSRISLRVRLRYLRANVRWFFQEELPVYKEEYITPLTVIAQTVLDHCMPSIAMSEMAGMEFPYLDFSAPQNTFTTAWNAIKRAAQSKVVQHALLPVRQLSQFGSVLTAIHHSKHAKEVFLATAQSNFFYNLVPALLMHAVAVPLLCNLSFVGAAISLYGFVILGREAIRRASYNPIYHLCLSQALSKDLEWAVAQDVTQLLESSCTEGPEKVFSAVASQPELTQKFKTAFYALVAEDIAKIFISVFSNSQRFLSSLSNEYSLVEAGGELNETQPADSPTDYIDVLAAKLTDHFKGNYFAAKYVELIKEQKDACVQEIQSKLAFIPDVDAEQITKRSLANQSKQTQTTFALDSIATSAKTAVTTLPFDQLAKNMVQFIFEDKTAKAKYFLPLLPSSYFHAQTTSGLDSFYTLVTLPLVQLMGLRMQFAIGGTLSAAAYFAEAFLIGYGLLDSKFSLLGMGMLQRFDLISKNKMYCLALGGLVGLVGTGGVALLGALPGATGFLASFIARGAVFASVYQLFMTFSMLQKAPLPGEDDGLDIFRPLRAEAENSLQVVKEFKDPEFRVRLWGYWNHPMMLNARKILAGGKLKSPEQLVKVPAINLFFKLYGNDILDALNAIAAARDARATLRVVKFAADVSYFLSKYMPLAVSDAITPDLKGKSEKIGEVVQLISHEKVGDVIAEFKKLHVLAERYRNGSEMIGVELSLTEEDNFAMVNIAKSLSKLIQPKESKSTLLEQKEVAEDVRAGTLTPNRFTNEVVLPVDPESEEIAEKIRKDLGAAVVVAGPLADDENESKKMGEELCASLTHGGVKTKVKEGRDRGPKDDFFRVRSPLAANSKFRSVSVPANTTSQSATQSQPSKRKSRRSGSPH